MVAEKRLACRNANDHKYYCQHAHAMGACATERVRRECVASCSCADDRRGEHAGRHADPACLPRFADAPRSPASMGTLLLVNSHCDSPFLAPLLGDLARVPLPTLVVYGGCARTALRVHNDSLATLRVVHDSIDFTAMIGLLDHWEQLVARLRPFDRVFYTHDSVRVQPERFARSLRQYNRSRTCGLQMGQSMNMGLYAVRDLRRANRSFLPTVRGRDHATPAERLQLKLRNVRGVEGAVLDLAGAWAHYADCGCQLTDGPAARQPLNLTLGARVLPRVALKYPRFGITKYQTNGGPPMVFR